MLNKILLFPFGGNTREAIIAINAINRIEQTWEVLGFVDDDPLTHGKEESGVKVLGGRDILKKYPDAKVLVAQANSQNYQNRKDVIASLGLEPERFATIIHPSVVMSDNVKIGCNCLIMANTVVSTNVFIGNHSIILPNTTIAHDVIIDAYCCIGANVSVSGRVKMEESCYIGSGSCIRQELTIGSKSLVGLGSVVVKNVDPNIFVVGNPAKLLTV